MSLALQFAVFSFNRGPFLRHCVASIEQFAPGCLVHVVDDGSDDSETCRVLELLARTHRVTIASKTGVARHGGLYANMQRALDTAQPEQPLCLMQDDTQLVRPLAAQDGAAIEHFFAHAPKAAFLSPTFIRRASSARPADALAFDVAAGVYWPKPTGQRAGVHYSDVVITQPQRLRQAGWQFMSGEPANEQQARTKFGRMGILFVPFAMWLPLVPAYRGKRKTLALRLGEKRSGCGFHPIAPMAAAAVADMRSRDPEDFPYAEDFLHLMGRDLEQPWRYNGLQGQRDLKVLNSIETRLGWLRMPRLSP